MKNLKRCSKCTSPETHETILFDQEGVCNVCRQNEYKKEHIDWEVRGEQFEELIQTYKGKYDYDCIVPFSGGKDSTFTLYKLVKDYGLKPLVVSFDHGFYRPTVEENKLRTFRELGVDVIRFTPNWKIVKKLMLEALKQKGDFCWHCHTGVFSYPMQVAIKYNVPLVIWGEPSSEYTSYYSYDDGIEEVDEERFNKLVNLGMTADDMRKLLGEEVSERDLNPFTYPKLKDLKVLNYRSVCLGSFIPWDVRKHAQIIETELGWKEEVVEGVPPEYGYEKIECAMQGIRDYLKYIKRGYARTTHLTSIDIRNGRMNREEALNLIEKYEGKKPKSLEVFLEYVGITEEEFNKIAIEQIIEPNTCTPSELEEGQEVWDQKLWYRESKKESSLKDILKEYENLKLENEHLKKLLENKNN